MLKKLGIITTMCFSAIGCRNIINTFETFPYAENSAGSGFFGSYAAPEIRLKNTPDSIIVCRNKQCAPSKLSTSKEYVYNTLLRMFDSNAHKKALVCQADANTHSCTEEYVSLPITVGITPAYMYIDDVKISDVSLSPKNTAALDLILNWGVSYNGQTPTCRPSKTLLYVKDVNNTIMEDNGYECKMTTIGSSSVKTLFAIDYIDLDYSYIGGFYSIGVSGPAYGGGSGYMVMRLPEFVSMNAGTFQRKSTVSALPITKPTKVSVTATDTDSQPADSDEKTKEPAPNVDTIIRYNSAAAEYHKKKAELDNAQGNITQLGNNISAYQGVQVMPVQRKKVTPKLVPVEKNLLNEYKDN